MLAILGLVYQNLQENSVFLLGNNTISVKLEIGGQYHWNLHNMMQVPYFTRLTIRLLLIMLSDF